MTRRLTCDRFYGGVENRIENLHLFLTYLRENRPSRSEAVGWLEQTFDATSEMTRDRYLSFLRGLDLVDRSGGRLTPGLAGFRYLETESAETFFEILDSNIAGFDLIIDALVTRGPLSDKELRKVLNNGPYGHDMEGPGVAIRHREWLQALGYVYRITASSGDYQYGLTTSGHTLWHEFENGMLKAISGSDDESPRPDAPLYSIPNEPVPDFDSDVGDLGDHPPEEPNEATGWALKTQRRATIEHQEVVAWLRDTLQSSGYEVRQTRYSDLIAYRDTEARILLLEVKSIRPQNVWEQVRKAIGQVLEYEYTDVLSREDLSDDVQPGICLSQAPPSDVQDYLRHLVASRELIVIWRRDGQRGIAGPSSRVVIDRFL